MAIGAQQLTGRPSAAPRLVRAVLAVLIGVGFWAGRTVMVNPVIERAVSIDVTVRGRTDGATAPKPDPAQVSLLVRGQVETLDREPIPGMVTAYVSFEEMGEDGRAPVRLETETIHGVEILSWSPERVVVQKMDSKLVAVRIRPTGEGAATIKDPVATPAELTVTGPKEFVDRIEVVEAGVPAADLLEGWVDTANLYPLDKDGTSVDSQFVRIEPHTVRVSVEPKTDTVAVRLSTVGKPAEGYEVKGLSAEPARVKVRGGQDRPELLVGIDAEPIDVTDRKTSFDAVASLRPPEGVTPYEASSVTVTVTIGPK